MPNYTTNLNLEKPLGSEQYNIDVLNANADKIDQFAGETPARALTADKLTTGAKINGVNFKGDTDIVTGAGFYYDTVTYGVGDLAFIYNQNSALELHKSLVAGNIGHNPLTTTGYWQKQELGSGRRNVGEIIPSTLPLTDAGLHLLDGARLSGDGIYKEFVEYIADLYTANSNANYFTTESNWQASVTQYGSCGKFVYDSTLNTVRLPKVSDILQGTTDVTALGNLIEAGLPILNMNTTGAHTHKRGTMEITGAVYSVNMGSANTDSGALSQSWKQSAGNLGTTSINHWGEIKLKASNGWTGETTSNGNHTHTTYWDGHNNASTVQPQTIKVLYYIVISNSTKTQIEVDIDEIATDLNGKADVDLTNINSSCKALDGQWVNANLVTLSTTTTIGSYSIDISSYLPNDNYNYEIFLSLVYRANGNCAISISTPIFNNNSINFAQSVDYISANMIIPVNNTRTITFVLAGNAPTTGGLQLVGYRRIGTNQ